MNAKQIHTSESLKAQDDPSTDNFHYTLDLGDQYLLTDGEADWLFNWVRGKYCIADHLIENIENTDEGYVYTMDPIGLGEALTEDQCFPKAVMLSDDTALQAIMFYSACEPIEC
jgi:hypothetical protein